MNLKLFLNLIFPPLCVGCGKNTGSGVICAVCRDGIALNQTLFCGECKSRLASGKKICHKDFPYVLGAATEYRNDAVRNLIHGLKFKFSKQAAAVLGGFLAEYAERLGISFSDYLVLPIPLSPARLRKRGFNQAELIARVFAERFSLPLATNVLARVKNTKPQSEAKNVGERRENVRACFVVKNTTSVFGKNIVLIDDVTTSGATLLEAALTLKSAGAKKIIALTAARA